MLRRYTSNSSSLTTVHVHLTGIGQQCLPRNPNYRTRVWNKKDRLIGNITGDTSLHDNVATWVLATQVTDPGVDLNLGECNGLIETRPERPHNKSTVGFSPRERERERELIR